MGRGTFLKDTVKGQTRQKTFNFSKMFNFIYLPRDFNGNPKHLKQQGKLLDPTVQKRNNEMLQQSWIFNPQRPPTQWYLIGRQMNQS